MTTQEALDTILTKLAERDAEIESLTARNAELVAASAKVVLALSHGTAEVLWHRIDELESVLAAEGE